MDSEDKKKEIELRPAVPSGGIRLIGLVIGGKKLDQCAVPTCFMCVTSAAKSSGSCFHYML